MKEDFDIYKSFTAQLPEDHIFKDRLPPLVWDLLKYDQINQGRDILTDSGLVEFYHVIRSNIENSNGFSGTNQPNQMANSDSLSQLFMESQFLLKKIRFAVKILYKERLAHMISELIGLKIKLTERTKQLKSAFKDSIICRNQ